jgi:O-antigen/teichoic acid export membrane protein
VAFSLVASATVPAIADLGSPATSDVADVVSPGPGTPDSRRARIETLAVSVALLSANALGYVFNITAARAVAPELYGALGSLMALLLVGVVPAMGLQTATALHIAGLSAADRVRGERRLLASGLVTAGLVSGVVLLVSPLIRAYLHLPSLWPLLWLAVGFAPLTLHGLFQGTLQGNRRFGALAALVIVDGTAKFGGGLVGLLVTRTLTGTVAGIACGAVVISLTGWLLCGRRRPLARSTWAAGMLPGRGWRDGQDRNGRVAGKIVHATWPIFGMVLLINLDVMLARHHLPAAAAGDYAVGAVVTKIALWLPQAVGVVVLPRLADPADRRRAMPWALGLIALLDSAVVLVAVVLRGSLFEMIGGSQYGGYGDQAWMFAMIGSLLALAYLLLYSRIAVADRWSSAAVWVAVAVEVGLATLWLHDSLAQVATAALVSTGGLVLFGLTVERRTTRAAVRERQGA